MTLFYISNHRERSPFFAFLTEQVPGIVFLSLDDISQMEFQTDDRLLFHFPKGRTWHDLPAQPQEQLSPGRRLSILYLFPRSFDPDTIPVNFFLYADDWLKMPVSPEILIQWLYMKELSSPNPMELSELHQALNENAPDGIIIINQSGIIQNVNAAFCQICGLKPENVFSKHYATLVNEMLPSEYTQGFLKLISEGALSNRRQKINFPYRDKMLELIFTDSNKKMQRIMTLRDISQEQQARDELLAVKNYYETVFQTSMLAMTIFNDEMLILRVNQECEAITHYDADELTGRKWLEFVFEPDLPILTKPWQNRQKGHHNETHSYQVRMLRKDGSIRRTLSNVRRIPNSAHWVVAIEDITEQWEKNLQLKQSEAFSRQIFDAVNDAMFIYPVDENGIPGHFYDVNQAACEIFGFNREEFKRKGPEDIDPIYDEAGFKKFSMRVLKEGNAVLESKHRIQKGKHIPVEISTRFFSNDGLTFFISSARDIRERKKNEIILQEERDLFRSLIDNLPDAIFFKDRSHRFIEVNRAKAASHHLNREEFIGCSGLRNWKVSGSWLAALPTISIIVWRLFWVMRNWHSSTYKKKVRSIPISAPS
ncbi:MAG TPA: PAS domain S-box protein [Candidatus Marinimicrobia bacterium]|nr:PAS domain S-box protein [Candidatus Neomarinimicrobiota bacterium]